MADQLTEEQISEYKEAFMPFELKDEVGVISADNLTDVLKSLGSESVIIQDMLQEFGSKGLASRITFPEFLEFIVRWMKRYDDVEEDVLEPFKEYDTNGDGFISVDDIKAALRKAGVEENELQEVISEAEFDSSNRVNYEDLVRKMMSK